MPNNGKNRWGVGYPAIQFMEQVLNFHQRVKSFERANDIQFFIQRTDLPAVNAVFVEQYEFGVASLYAVLGEFQGVTVVVNNGNWNHIAFDRMELSMSTGVVAFAMKDFMGALNVARLDKYVPRDERQTRPPRRRTVS